MVISEPALMKFFKVWKGDIGYPVQALEELLPLIRRPELHPDFGTGASQATSPAVHFLHHILCISRYHPIPLFRGRVPSMVADDRTEQTSTGSPSKLYTISSNIGTRGCDSDIHWFIKPSISTCTWTTKILHLRSTRKTRIISGTWRLEIRRD